MKPFCRSISVAVLREALFDQCPGYGTGVSGTALATRQWHPTLATRQWHPTLATRQWHPNVLRCFAAFFTACLICVTGCRKSADSDHGKSEAPAKVAHPGDEQTLNTITLSARADQRLGIKIAEARLADVQQQRTFGGEVVVPPGQTILVSTPIAGTLSEPEDSPLPLPGSEIAAGQAVYDLLPLLSPERDMLTPAERIRVAQTRADVATAQIEAERQVESAVVEVEAARITRDRAAQLLRDKAGSQRSLDAADAELRLASERLETAQVRHEFLSGIRLDEEAGELTPRTITSPVAGVLQSVSVAAGELVAAGQTLFSVVKLDRVWIRVPVYVGCRRDIDTEQAATVEEYGLSSGSPPLSAKYVSAPPSADPNATTVDLFYELPNPDRGLYPGHKLAVTLPMRGRESSLVVPWPAILYDIHGGSWVYEQIAPLTYVRRRVDVRYIDGSDAVLAAGPQPGAKVVTDGAAELFGTEFGVGK